MQNTEAIQARRQQSIEVLEKDVVLPLHTYSRQFQVLFNILFGILKKKSFRDMNSEHYCFFFTERTILWNKLFKKR